MLTAIESMEAVVPFRERWHHLGEVLPEPSTIFWFVVSLVLFMILGPFSAPIALIAILGRGGGQCVEPEPRIS